MISGRGVGGDVPGRRLSMKYFVTFARFSFAALMLSYEKCQANRTKPCETSEGPPSTHLNSVGIIKSGGNYIRRKRYALLSRQQVVVRRSLPRPIDCLTSQRVGGISGGGREGRLLAIIVDNTRFMNMLRAILQLAGRVIRAFLEHLKRGRIIT